MGSVTRTPVILIKKTKLCNHATRLLVTMSKLLWVVFFLIFIMNADQQIPCSDDIDRQLRLHCFHSLSFLQFHWKNFFFFSFYYLRIVIRGIIKIELVLKTTITYIQLISSLEFIYRRKEGTEMKKNKYQRQPLRYCCCSFFISFFLLSLFIFYFYFIFNINWG